MLLSLLIWLPLVLALVLALLPREPALGVRRTAVAFALVPFALSLLVLAAFVLLRLRNIGVSTVTGSSLPPSQG